MFLVSDTPLTLIFDPLKLCEDKSTNDSCGDPCQCQRASKRCHLNAFSQISAVPVAGLHWRPRRSHCAGRWQDQPPAPLLVSCAPTSDVASADAVDGPWESHQLHVIYTIIIFAKVDRIGTICLTSTKSLRACVCARGLWESTKHDNSFESQLTIGWNAIVKGCLVGNSSGSIFQSSHWAWKAACRR